MDAFSPCDCGSWRCDECGIRKRRRYRAAVHRWAAERRLKWVPMLTVTLSSAGFRGRSRRRDHYDELQRVFSEAVRRFRQRVEGDVEYVRVQHLHSSGYAHFHVLLAAPRAAELAGLLVQLGEGVGVDLTWVKPHRTVNYLLNRVWERIGLATRLVSGSSSWSDVLGTTRRVNPWWPSRRRVRRTLELRCGGLPVGVSLPHLR